MPLPRWGDQVAAAIMPPERRARRSETCSARLLLWLWLQPPPTRFKPSNLRPQLQRSVVGARHGHRHGRWPDPILQLRNQRRGRDNAKACSVAGGEAALAKTSSSSGAKDQVTRITFERRFSPEAKAELTDLKPGDTLIGGQVMALAIDGTGAVKGCKVVATSGSVTPQYGCEEAAAERFEASAATAHAHTAGRQGYLTVLVYGHSEHVV